jgi:hypothetical protein
MEHLNNLIPNLEAFIPSHVKCLANKLANLLANEGINIGDKPLGLDWNLLPPSRLKTDYTTLALVDFSHLYWVVGKRPTSGLPPRTSNHVSNSLTTDTMSLSHLFFT